MLYRPSQINSEDSKTSNLQIDTEKNSQHGIYNQQQPIRHDNVEETQSIQRHRSILLDVPPETLTSITSHLTLPALLSLGCVSSYLAHHVKEDNTWRRAFACYFLGISPESDIELENAAKWAHVSMASGSTFIGSWKTLLMRREEGRTWRDEFAWRYVMVGRWSRSRSTPTSHTPLLHSPISNIHLTTVPSASFSQASSSSVPQATSSSANGDQSSALPTPYVYPSVRFGTPALLTTSIQYGVVARSMPLVGRVLTGYLDASAGARLGVDVAGNPHLGINGNPNAQFTPNVTSCDVVTSLPSSPASTAAYTPSARVVWGTRAGELIFSTAPRAIDGTLRTSGGAGVQVKRCRVGDEHEGMVRDVKFVNGDASELKGRWAVSAGEDGRVKIWDAGAFATLGTNPPPSQNDAINCVWSSDPMLVDRFGSRVAGVVAGGGILPDKCVRAEAYLSTTDTSTGTVVAVGESGDVHVWIGRTLAFGVGSGSDTNTTIRKVCIDCPFKTVDGAARRIAALYIEPIPIQGGEDKRKASFLVAYEDDPLFYRVRVAVAQEQANDQENGLEEVEIVPFGNPNFGPTSVVVPHFGTKDASFVLVGDHIGCVSLYAWDAPSSASSSFSTPTPPLRTFEAHRDGASVTALWWDGLVLVTGSARGTTHVWDALTFAHLRSFISPVGRIRGRGRGQGRLVGGALALAPHGAGGAWDAGVGAAGGRGAVRHIVVNPEKDVLVVAVGDTVMAWHAGEVRRGPGGKGGVRGRHAPGTGVHGKKKAGAGVAKYVGQYEMRQTIAESRDLLETERKVTSTSSLALTRREIEHRAGLDSLGLSEMEAVEYVLMLSRDEAATAAAERARRMEEEGEYRYTEEQGVFEHDFEEATGLSDEDNENDDVSLYGPSPSVSSGLSSGGSSTPSGSLSPSVSVSSSSASLSSTRGRARLLGTRLGMAITHRGPPRTPSGQPILGPSRSNEKVHVSLPWHGVEPKEAGEEYLVDDHVGEDEGLFADERDEVVQAQHFPPIPGSAGISPGEEREMMKGKSREQRKVTSPSASLLGKGKGKGKSDTKSKRDGAEVKSQTSPSVTPNLDATLGGWPGPSLKPSKASAWSVPLKAKEGASTSGRSTSSFAAVAGTAAAANSPPRAGAWARSRISPPVRAVVAGGEIHRRPQDDVDEDLRFALELSLVEARSREEDV